MPAIWIDQRPVFEVHVAVADDHAEGQTTYKFHKVLCAAFGCNDLRNVAHTGLLVFAFSINPKNLREILDMDTPATRQSIKSLNDKCVFAELLNACRHVLDGIETDKIYRGHIHAHHCRKLHH